MLLNIGNIVELRLSRKEIMLELHSVCKPVIGSDLVLFNIDIIDYKMFYY